MRRFITAAGVVALALAALPSAADQELAPGQPLPMLEAETLSGTSVRFPGDAHGEPVMLLIAFSQRAGEASATWSHALHQLAPSLAIYAVADLSRVPGVFRGFAIAGIRKQASPVEPEHRNQILLITRKNRWRDLIPPGSDDDVAAVAVDRDARVAAIERQPFSDEAAHELLSRLRL